MAKKNKEMSKYETARVLGARALQISEGAPLCIKLSDKELEEINYDPYRVAKIELEKGKIPLGVIIKETKTNISDEVLKHEAEVAKLEKELNISEEKDTDADAEPETDD